MTEREFWAARILDIACNGSSIALQDGKPVPCDENILCRECGFFPKEAGRPCADVTREWCKQAHREEKSNESEG